VHCGYGVPGSAFFVCSEQMSTPLESPSSTSEKSDGVIGIELETVEALLDRTAGDDNEVKQNDANDEADVSKPFRASEKECPFGVQNDTSLLLVDALFFYGERVCAYNVTTTSVSCPPTERYRDVLFACQKNTGLQTLTKSTTEFHSVGGVRGIVLSLEDKSLDILRKNSIVIALQCTSQSVEKKEDGCSPFISYLKL
jgi:hypothetical protein